MRYDEFLGLVPRLKGIENSAGGPFGLELLFWAIVILFTIALVRYRPILFEKAEVRLREVSRHKGFWLATFGLAVIFVRLALLPWIPVPVPLWHDENSYLLASDTFAHGRLTNPPSPMWVHFESIHINVQPTYQSMYPPAQGLALAIGQVLTGVPWIGVLLSTALMCGAIYWMLLGWFSAPWAWLGGAFACVRFGIFSYWMNTYYGGAVAALGGALVVGAFARFRNGPRIRTALVFASGLLILANSRPLEGLLFSIPLVLAVVILLIRGVTSGRVTWGATAKAVLPAVALLAVGAGWMLYYNWRGTGNPLLMPYQVNYQTYHISKPFPFQQPNPIPEYRHLSMRTFYVYYEMTPLLMYKYNILTSIYHSAGHYYGFFIWPFSLLIVPCACAMWRSEMRAVLISMALVSANLLAQIWPPRAHYAAPAAGAVILWLLFSVRHFRESQSKYAIWGSRALAIVLAVGMISPILETLRDPFNLSIFYENEGSGLKGVVLPSHIRRAWIQSELDTRSGKQLIVVHYPYGDMGLQDWIYNDADIDRAHVVWARDMGYLKNKELLNYYPDRQAWFVDRGDPALLLVPYDQVMAPLKLAFDAAAPEKDFPHVASVGQHLSSPIAKPANAGLAEIVASPSR
jgi:hypothetical protein